MKFVKKIIQEEVQQAFINEGLIPVLQDITAIHPEQDGMIIDGIDRFGDSFTIFVHSMALRKLKKDLESDVHSKNDKVATENYNEEPEEIYFLKQAEREISKVKGISSEIIGDDKIILWNDDVANDFMKQEVEKLGKKISYEYGLNILGWRKDSSGDAVLLLQSKDKGK